MEYLPTFTINSSQIDGKNSIHGAFGILTIHCPEKLVQVFIGFTHGTLSLFLENPLEVLNERSEGPWRRRPLHSFLAITRIKTAWFMANQPTPPGWLISHNGW